MRKRREHDKGCVGKPDLLNYVGAFRRFPSPTSRGSSKGSACSNSRRMPSPLLVPCGSCPTITRRLGTFDNISGLITLVTYRNTRLPYLPGLTFERQILCWSCHRIQCSISPSRSTLHLAIASSVQREYILAIANCFETTNGHCASTRSGRLYWALHCTSIHCFLLTIS